MTCKPTEETNYKYLILPGKLRPGVKHQTQYESAYEHWKTTWSRIFQRRGDPEYFNPYDFMRQDFISCIFDGEQVVAQDMSTFFSIQSALTLDTPYFSAFKEHALPLLLREGASQLLTIEYISVNPSYSYRKTGIPFGEIIVGLGVKLVQHFQVSATTGMPRRIAGVDKIAKRFGARTVCGGVRKAGLGLDLIVGLRHELCEHPKPTTREAINQFWQSRIDLTRLTQLTPLSQLHQLSESSDSRAASEPISSIHFATEPHATGGKHE